MSMLPKSNLKYESITVGELVNFTSPNAIQYSRMKCIKNLFVLWIKYGSLGKY